MQPDASTLNAAKLDAAKPSRVFLDWQRPTLLAAVDYLRERYVQHQQWDLANVVLVVPAKRAARRLLELLVFEAAERGLRFSPPTMVGEGSLPELLYQPKKPFADALTQDLAWSHALRRLSPQHLAAILKTRPHDDDDAAWLKLAQVLRVRHTELAADTLTFLDIVKFGHDRTDFPDTPRWQAMAAAQEIYHRTLDNLNLWDIQSARLVAIEKREIRTAREIVLLAAVDLNNTLRAFLGQVASNVTALIAAPQTHADRFDDFGGVLPEPWLAALLPLEDRHVSRVAGAADQADRVAQIVASYEGKYRGDQITIGVPDEALVPQLQRQLEQCGVPARWVQGKLLADTGPFRLLQAAGEFLAGESTRAFAALVRHADVYGHLTSGDPAHRVRPRVLDELDRLMADYLITRMQPALWPYEVRQRIENQLDFVEVVKAAQQVGELLSPLRQALQGLSQWSQPILSVLSSIYALQGDDPIALTALEKIRNVLQTQTLLPTSLEPKLTASEAITWTLDQLRSVPIPPVASENAIELLGWFELFLDDAPAIVITTFNEGYVPESAGDSFLPNSIRKSLGLMHGDRRYARDAYFLQAILCSRETVQLISARHDAAENPLAPSRLLFATSPDLVVSRARTFFQPLADSPPRLPLVGAGTPPLPCSALVVPLPQASGGNKRSSSQANQDDRQSVDIAARLRVTQFRDYLACPYRFYLRHVLGLQSASDQGEELAANAFGNLIHKVLEAFGAHAEIRESIREDDIAAFLFDQLQKQVRMRHGDEHRLASLEVQVEQIKARLRRFARWQAERARDGWRIVFAEQTEEASSDEPTEQASSSKPTAANKSRPAKPNPTDAVLLIDEQPIRIGGRIDRIDQRDGVLTIFDYKTGDAAAKPAATHRSKKEWIDLQLPLYRYLAQAWGFTGPLQLGYILVPKALEETGEAIADWTDDDLASADATMQDVVRRIRRGEFWPPAKPPLYPDDFTAICQDRRLGGRLFGSQLETIVSAGGIDG